MSQKSDILRKKLVLVNTTSNITFAESLILVCWSLFLIKLQAKTCNLSRTKFQHMEVKLSASFIFEVLPRTSDLIKILYIHTPSLRANFNVKLINNE